MTPSLLFFFFFLSDYQQNPIFLNRLFLHLPHALISHSFTFLINLAGEDKAWVHSKAKSALKQSQVVNVVCGKTSLRT